MSGQAARASFLVLGAVVVTMAALTVWPSDEASEEGSAPGKTSLRSGVTVEEAPDSLDAYRGGSDVDGPADDRWREVALGFARDLASHDGDHAAWRVRVSRWVTPALAESYQHTDPRLLPEPSPMRLVAWSEGLGAVDATLAMDEGTTLVVRLERRPQGSWVVAGAEPM